MAKKNAEKLSSTIVPSEYQNAIFEWGLNGKGNAIIEAVAGSGKSTSLIALYTILSEKYGDDFDALFCAFNVAIVKELKKRLPVGANCNTINSLGNTALVNNLGPLNLKADKYNTLAFESLKTLYIPKKDFQQCLAFIKQVVALMQANLKDATKESLKELIEYYSLIIPNSLNFDSVFSLMQNIMHVGMEFALKERIISYDDQIWIPAKLKMETTKYSFILIDEAQDLSKAKLELIMQMTTSDTRIIAVGDLKQAIFSFSGSDIKSMERIKERINPTILPLNISYRCSKAVIKEAQKLVPYIDGKIDAIEGSVSEIDFDEMMNKIKAKDMVLCRLNAPLVSTCIYFLKHQIPSKIMGSDIGRQLFNNVKQIVGFNDWNKIEYLLQEYSKNEVKRIMNTNPNPDAQLQIIFDRVDTIKAIVEGFSVKSLDEFQTAIDSIFSDKEALITLATVHKAKGMEAQNVFIIEKQKLPLRWKNQRNWELQAEFNLEYVAITRAKENLYFVRSRT